MKTRAKAGLTIVELLVVIAIIGILAGVLLTQFGGATESAKATQCMTNLRNLAVAVQNYGMQSGCYPAAGSFKATHIRAKKTYPVVKGWISWDLRNESSGNASVGASIPFSVADEDTRRWALTNGAIWKAVGGSVQTYQCPVHAEACRKANGRYPAWSYVMSERFGYTSDGKPRGTDWRGQSINGFDAADKVLLFAELQGLTISDRDINITPQLSASGTAGDSVLQYDKQKESIGFNHKMAHGRYTGHVAFADGHVEKIQHPRTGSVQELTEWLCRGYEVSFDGKQYLKQTN